MFLFNPNDHDTKKGFSEAQNCLILGVLAKPNAKYPNMAREALPITMNKSENGILIFVQSISPEPDIISQLDGYFAERNASTLYIARKQDLGSHILPPGFQYYPDEKRIDLLKGRLENRIIVFRPKVTLSEDGERVYKNLQIVSCSDTYKEGVTYESIPKVSMDNESFETALIKQEPMLINDFTYHDFGPDYILCGEVLYKFKNGWEKHSLEWKLRNPKGTVKANLSDDWNSHYIFGTDQLLFFEKGYLENLDRTYEWHSIGETPFETKFDSKVELPSHQPEHISTSKPADKNSLAVSEHQFLEHLQTLTHQRGLCYTIDALVNFHVSVKTNAITILSGMSGTGKSQLAMSYAEALGLYNPESKSNEITETNRLLLLPIKPSYKEPEDLIGYLNAATGLYVPAETGFVDFLVQAQNDSGRMYMVVFDEMNLAQVEHWFSPFISLLEFSDEPQRTLRLYSNQQICHNASKYPDTVHIGENVLFIGTANIDETTRNFSDRLLDRVNVVVPDKMKFTDVKNKLKRLHDDAESAYGYEHSERFGQKNVYRRWISTGDVWNEFTMDELEFFDELHMIIHTADSQKGVSFRSLKKIGEYLKNVPLNGEGEKYQDRRKLIDLQVKQRILTKIRGSAEQFRELIGESANENDEINSLLYQHFTSEAARAISDFELTIAEIRRKAREMHMYDYAS